MNQLLVLVLALGGWVLFLYYLVRIGVIQGPPEEGAAQEQDGPELHPWIRRARSGLSLMGPFLMLKTIRGRELIDRIAAAKRFWKVFGDVGIGLVLGTMALMTGLLVWTAILAPSLPPERAPTPQTIIGLPGINPAIPLWYGIMALAVAIVAHEFCHGILARVAKVRIVSLGVLLLLLPLGAFVEPDEAELKKVDKRARARMFAAGPAVNIIFALTTAVLFSLVLMPNVSPAAEGVGVVSAYAPPALGNITEGTIITHINGQSVNSISDVEEILQNPTVRPGDLILLTIHKKGEAPTQTTLILADKFTQTGVEEDKGKPGIGVRLTGLDTGIFNPFAQIGKGNTIRSFLAYIFLPFQGLAPIQEPITNFYVIGGAWAATPEWLFWITANSIYWLFWINLMLGMTNALPAVPLDGGYLFKDLLDGALRRLKATMGTEARERVARNLSLVLALFILALILWQMIVPRIGLP